MTAVSPDMGHSTRPPAARAKPACPTCGPDAGSSFHSERSGYRLVSCRECGLVFLENFSDEINDEFYADAQSISVNQRENKDEIEYWSYPEFFDRHRDVFDKFFSERWQSLCRARPAPQSLLDVGCGYGFFLNFIKDRVPRVQGLELDATVGAHAHELFGLDVMATRIEDFEPSEPFECITMCDVLEHLVDPAGVLEHCRDCLTPDGVIYVQVPNLVGFRLPPGHGWGLPHHLWQFGPKNLQRLFEKCGFEVLGWETGVLGVIGVYENGGPSLKTSLMWTVARKLKIGNRLAMIARKK